MIEHDLTRERVARMVDHTLLAPEATRADAEATVLQAAELGVFAVCLSPSMLPIAPGDQQRLAVVAGFPSGKHHALVKAAEARIREYREKHGAYAASVARSGGQLLFHLISKLYEQTSVIITTNLAFKQWGSVFPGAACVVALVEPEVAEAEGREHQLAGKAQQVQRLDTGGPFIERGDTRITNDLLHALNLFLELPRGCLGQLGLIPLALGHELADRLRHSIALCVLLSKRRDLCPPFFLDFEEFVDRRRGALFGGPCPNEVRLFTNKSAVEHRF